ncbi:MAG: hypothetical protein R2793_06690 [Flavobacteriaceae bacterium]
MPSASHVQWAASRFLPAMILLQNGKILQVPVQHFPGLPEPQNLGCGTDHLQDHLWIALPTFG